MAAIVRWVKSGEVPDPILRNWLAMYEALLSDALITNVQTEVRCISVDDRWFFPVTINNTEWKNSYVVAPYNAYVTYAEEELKREISNKLAVIALLPLIRALGPLLKLAAINKVVHINNFIFSTNPYPAWHGEGMDAISTFIVSQYPKHMVVFRSLNEQQNSGILAASTSCGFRNIVSRQIYMYEPDRRKWQRHNNNYQDTRKLKQLGLRHLNHSEMGAYLPEALRLYNLLYLEKYSVHNPQFTLAFFRECHENHLLHFQGYIDGQGTLLAFSGLFIYGGTITSPLVGYDTAAPLNDGLYIHAIRSIFEHMFESGLILNLSSGAAKFKRLRGGKPCIEYSALYYSHLGLTTRAVNKLLEFVSNRIGKPLLEKYEL